MEEEEREAQSAKLQELIRRGTPADLQEANRLMKVMAGYDNRHKTDYRAKAAEEVSKVQEKAKILEEMLQSQAPGDRISEGDVFEVWGSNGAAKRYSDMICRSWRMRFKVHTRRSRKCARKNQRIQKLCASYWRSTTAYTEPSSGTSS